jgi:hypothetical protein
MAARERGGEVTHNGRRNRLGFVRRRLLREAEKKEQTPMATFEPDPDAPSPVFGITPERLAKTQAAIDDLAGTLNSKRA